MGDVFNGIIPIRQNAKNVKIERLKGRMNGCYDGVIVIDLYYGTTEQLWPTGNPIYRIRPNGVTKSRGGSAHLWYKPLRFYAPVA